MTLITKCKKVMNDLTAKKAYLDTIERRKSIGPEVAPPSPPRFRETPLELPNYQLNDCMDRIRDAIQRGKFSVYCGELYLRTKAIIHKNGYTTKCSSVTKTYIPDHINPSSEFTIDDCTISWRDEGS